MLRQLMLVCAVGFLAIAVADYAFERHQHYKQLRMSKDEVKREYKEMEAARRSRASAGNSIRNCNRATCARMSGAPR